jgi:surface antigen
MQKRSMQGNVLRNVTKKLVAGLIGCAAGIFAPHAASAAIPSHKVTSRIIIHTATYHPVYKRPIYWHPIIKHIVYHRPIEHHLIIRRPIYRAPLIHYAVRKTYHHIDYHPLYRRADYLWCVPYARDVSHIDITGDAFLWWAEAAGRYARGQRPADGAVLNFRSSARIPLGHVAVVAKVINSREILVNQANWVPDQVSHDVPVIDVSPDNNWTMVRVSIGGGHFGAPYPTYGFIYDQPIGGGAIYASRSTDTEVAAAPPVRRLRLTAPNRSVR